MTILARKFKIFMIFRTSIVSFVARKIKNEKFLEKSVLAGKFKFLVVFENRPENLMEHLSFSVVINVSSFM